MYVRRFAVFAVAVLLTISSANAAAFTPGNVVVYRVGTGVGALGNAATAIFLDEYTPAGTLVQSIPLPTADSGANQTLTASGTATSDGLMTRSADGQYLVLGGYDAAVGTAAVVATTSAAVPRVIGRVSVAGVVDTSTVMTDSFSTGNIRGVASVDGSAFWASGSNTGVVRVVYGATTSTVVSTTGTNLRGTSIYSGQLYVSSGAGTLRVGTVGSGTPATSGQTITNLPGFPTTATNPNQFFLTDLDAAVAGLDTAYVTDERSIATGGGLQKWTFDGTTWTQRGTLSTGLSNGLRGVTGSVSGTNVTLYGTDAAVASRFVKATDTSGPGATITGSFSTLVTAATNTAFRSVALAPGVAAPVAPTVQSIDRVGATPTNATSVDFTVTFSENVTGVDVTDFTVTGTLTANGIVGSVTPVSGSVYTVTVSSVAGDGTIRLDLNSSGTGIASTPGGTPIATGFTTGQTYTIDHTDPTVTSVGVPPNGTYGTGQQLNFVANFSENVTVDFSTGIPFIPITLNTGGTVQASYAGGTGTSAIAFSYTVASGNLDLDGIAVGGSIVANGGTLRDAVSNDAVLTLNGVPSTAGVLVDATDPVVLSITRADANPTNATTIHFTVTFSTSVTGVDLTDFALTTTGAFSTPGITDLTGSGDTYTVTVQYSAGVGTIRLDLNDNDSIVNGSLTPLGGPGIGNGSFTTGQAYTVDTIPPAVQSMTRDGASPTNASTVSWTVVFDDNVTGVDASDFVAMSSSTTATISGVTPTNATTYVVSVNTGTANSDTIGLQLVDDDSIVDIGTNPLGGAGAGNGNFTAGTTYTIDRVVPVVSSIIRAGANPTAGPTVDFTVTFSKNVSGVDVTDFALATTGLSGTSVTNVATSNFVDYTVTANVGGGTGTIRLDLIDNDSISDSVGNLLGGAGPGNGNFTTGETYAVQAPPAAPTGLIATPGNNTVGLTWTASGSATSYNVKRSTTSGSGHTTIANVASPLYTDNAVTNGTTYYYVVSALNASGESPDSAQASATPNLPANQIGVVISQLYGGNGNAYASDYVELFNETASDVQIGGYSVQYGAAAGQFGGSTGTNIYTFPAGTTIGAARYLTVKFAPAGSGLAVPFDLDGTSSSINMSGTSGKVAFAASGTWLNCGATATPCALPHPNIVDLVAYGASNNGEGGTTVNNGAAISASSGPLRKLSGCQDTNNNNNDFIVATTATGLAPRTLATAAHVCGPLNFAPTITAPANPAATVAENAAPFTVTLTGNDDGGIYNWSATAGGGVSSVIIIAGQGTSSVTYQVTLQTNFYGTATFTAALTDNVNTPATQTVNIQVDRDVTINHVPAITPPANPITTVAQNSAPMNVNVTGNDDNNLYTWSATPGTGVTAVIVTAGQGTPTVTYNVTIQAGFIGTATFTASLSDGVNPATTQAVNIGVSPTGSSVTHIVISQIYGGGGNASATYQNDYVELYNPTGSPVSLNGWTLQYSAAANTGNFTGITPLAGFIGPGEYFLIGLAAGTNPAPALPAPNLNGDINMAVAGGKIALVRNFDALTGSCGTLLTDADIVDFVGYGTGNCSEGGSTAPAAPNNATALFRANNGDTDTDKNGADFSLGTPNPRRTSPIQEIGPFVIFTDPSNGENIAPRDANLVITFTEPVDITGTWYDITCAVTGNHNFATFSQSGTRSFTIVPNVNFQAGEQCTATLFASAIRDTDTDDTNPGTDFLPSNYIWTFTIASGTPPPFPSSVHLTMGNPSGAVADTNVPNNYLMEKPEMVLSYNRDKGTPNWVGWHLSDEWIGSLVRIDTFRADPAVLPTWYRVLGSDYSNSGFDRGHMMPNADRDKETSVPINQATFLMTNMLPQAPDNNQGPWANMENDLRAITGGSNELYIYSGGAGSGGTGSNGFATTIDNSHVAVPASTWKVLLVLLKASGDDVARVTAATRTIAVIMPNVQGIRTNDWHMYLTTVDAVESLTGYDFFSNVPDAIENAIEAGTDGTNPPGAANQSVSSNEDASASFTMNAVSPSGGPLTYTIVTPPAYGALTGTGANRTYTPVPDYNGSDSFTYRVNDGSRDSNVATVTITVLEVNDPPVANNDMKTASGTLSFPATDLTANDTAGPSNESAQTLTVTTVTETGNTHGTVSLSGGTVTYTPTSGYSGSADFSYTACDNGVTAGLSASQCASATVNLTVDAPVLVMTHFSVSAPANVTAGGPFNVTVTARDASNATVTGYTGTIHFTSSSAGTLPTDYTFVAGDNGSHTFSVTLTTTGSQTITVNAGDLNGSATTNVGAPAPGPATHFSVTAPANVFAGSAFNVTVTALDEANAVVTSFTGTVHFTSSGPGTLPADYTFVASDNGTHTFSATLTTGGTQTITVTSGSITGTVTTTVSMFVPPPVYLLITGPANATIGVPFNVTVSAHVSLNGPIVTAYGGTVSFSSSSAATLPPAYTYVEGDAGSHTFSLTPNAVGPMTISVADTDGNYSLAVTITVACATNAGTVPVSVTATSCANSAGNAASVFVPGASTWTWQIANGAMTSGQGTASIMFTAGASGSVALSVTTSNADGCALQSGSASVAISPAPTATLPSVVQGCALAPVSILVRLTGTPPFNIRWSDGLQQSNINATQITREFASRTSTTLRIVSVADASCATNTSSAPVRVVVVPAPVFLVEPEDVKIKGGETATLFVIAAGATQYQWFEGALGDETHPVGTSATFVTPALRVTTKYWARATGPCGSVDSREVTVKVVAGKRRAAGH